MTRHLERRILLLQILLGMVCCTSLSFLSLLLSRFGFNNLQIGLVMMAAACSTSIAKPCWGVFTDRVPCTKRILVVTLALGIASFTLLGTLGGASKGAAVVCVLLVEVTTGCMMGVVDSWIAKLIGTGCKINYGLTRAGISGAYAVSAACFGTVLDKYGVLPGAVALFVLLGLIALTVQGIPCPEERQEKKTYSLRLGAQQLLRSRPYLVLLAVYFLSTLTACAIDSFLSLRILELGGSERHVGYALFMTTVFEIPAMVCYSRLRRITGKSPAFFIAASVFFYGVKCLATGLAPNYQSVIGLCALQMLAFGIFKPAILDYLIQIVDVEYIGATQMLTCALGESLSAILGNALNGALADRFSVGGMMTMVSGFAFLGALAMAVSMKTQANKIVKT